MNRQTTENKNGKNCWTEQQYYGYILQHFKAVSSLFSLLLLFQFISYARYNIDDWLLSSFAAAALLLFCFDKRMGIKLTKTVANENEKMLRKQQIAKALRQRRRRASSECENPLTRN